MIQDMESRNESARWRRAVMSSRESGSTSRDAEGRINTREIGEVIYKAAQGDMRCACQSRRQGRFLKASANRSTGPGTHPRHAKGVGDSGAPYRDLIEEASAAVGQVSTAPVAKHLALAGRAGTERIHPGAEKRVRQHQGRASDKAANAALLVAEGGSLGGRASQASSDAIARAAQGHQITEG